MTVFFSKYCELTRILCEWFKNRDEVGWYPTDFGKKRKFFDCVEMKKENNFCYSLFHLVGDEGFEPPTLWV